MHKDIASFLRTRWGLEWIRFRRSPVVLTIASKFVRSIGINTELLYNDGLSIVEQQGIENLSGLMAGTIAGLQRKDAGLFRVNYVTNTSPVGVALLEDYLVSQIAGLGAEPVDLRRVTDSGTLIEVARTGNNQSLHSESAPPTMMIPSGRRYTTPDNAINYEVPLNTDALAIADLSPEEATSLLRGLKGDRLAVVLMYLRENYDWPGAWSDVVDALKLHSHRASILIGATDRIVTSIMAGCGYTTHPEDLGELAHALGQITAATTLVHNDNELALSSFKQVATMDFPGPIKIVELARCLAGVLLSAVVTEYVRKLGGPDALNAGLFEQLLMGHALARTCPTMGDFPTEADLLKHLGLTDRDTGGEIGARLSSQNEKNNHSPMGDCAPLEELEDIYRAANDENPVNRLRRYVQADNVLVVSAAVDRLQQAGRLAELPRPAEERVVLFDLDLTLFDYTEAREIGAAAALKELSLSIPLQDALDIYRRIVDRWVAIERLGFLNLRRSWNAEIIYYLTHLFASRIFSDKTEEVFDLLARMEKTDDDKATTLQLFESLDLGQEFWETLKSVQGDVRLQQNVRRACIQFERATERLEPFEDTRDVLSTLSALEGYHVYIATEGDLSIQWEKIEKLGLQDLISPANLIVTEGLAAPPILFNALGQAKRRLRESHLSRSETPEYLELEVETIRFFQELFRLFRHKKDGHFYGHALHVAVSDLMGGPTGDKFANVSPEAWDNLRPIKLATVGDRYTNDIFPLVKLFGEDRILSIRMLYGKYRNEEETSDSSPPPDFSINRLVSARNILLQDNCWAEKNPINRPHHFGVEIDDSRLAHVLIGLTMTSSISSISEALLEDRGLSAEEREELSRRARRELSMTDASTPLRDRLEKILVSG